MKHFLLGRVARVCSGVVFQAIVLVLLAVYFFRRNDVALFFGYDGLFCRQLTKYSYEWSDVLSPTALCPLWGLGDIKLGTDFWLSLPSLVSYSFWGASPNPVCIYTVTTLELFLSIWLLARSLECNRLVVILSAWAGSVFPMPFIVPVARGLCGFYAISGLIPFIMEQMSVIATIVALMVRLERGRRHNLLIGSVMIGLVYLLVFEFPTQFALVVPVLAACSLYCATVFVQSKRDLPKVGYCALLIAGILFCPAVFIVSMILWSGPSFFYSELLNSNAGHPTWEFVTMAVHGMMGTGWMNTIVYSSAALGAVVSFFSKSTPRRRIAVLYLSLASVILTFGLVVTFVLKSYGGILALYFEWTLWPLMFVFASQFFFEVFQRIILWLGPSEKKLRLERAVSSPVGVISLSAIIPLGFLLLIRAHSDARLTIDFPKPPAMTPLVDFLEKQLALRPDGIWKGSVANFCTARSPNTPITWMSQSLYDRYLTFATGNDHRGPGLWWYNIPTLFEYNQCMSPAFYFLVTRLFSNRTDMQSRNVVVLTKPNPRNLGLLGVRYFLCDSPVNLDSAANSVGVFNWQLQGMPNGVPIYVYEVKQPNLTGFSPTHVLFADSANDGMSKIESGSFDPQQDVVLHEKLSVRLTRCKDSSFKWKKDGAEVSASSDGWSLLVLPITYSRCLEMSRDIGNATDGGEVRLIRVNVGMTGILFHGRVKGTISMRFNPFSNPFGRVTDYLDFKKLLRETP